MGTELGTNQVGSRNSQRIQGEVSRQVIVRYRNKYGQGYLAPSCLPGPGLGMSVTFTELYFHSVAIHI